MRKGCIFLAFILLLTTIALAHGDEKIGGENIEEVLRGISVNLLWIGSVIIIILVVISISYENRLGKLKKFMFIGIIIPVIIVSLFLAGSTIYVNVISETKGPVHWHADFEIWNCGEKIDVIDPTGFSNRIGSSVFHEHGDNRIHVEGVVVDSQDVDLHNFIKVIGGKLSHDELFVSTNDGVLGVKNGELCDGKPGKLQAFVYKTIDSKSYEQEKLDDFEDYVLSSDENIPPGDCIIIEFGEDKEKTNRICETYRIAIEKGELSGS